MPFDVDGPVTTVPVSALRAGQSPRQAGENLEHVRALADTTDELPPIIVRRADMRVVDGMHRLRAARLRGDTADRGAVLRRRRPGRVRARRPHERHPRAAAVPRRPQGRGRTHRHLAPTLVRPHDRHRRRPVRGDGRPASARRTRPEPDPPASVTTARCDRSTASNGAGWHARSCSPTRRCRCARSPGGPASHRRPRGPCDAGSRRTEPPRRPTRRPRTATTQRPDAPVLGDRPAVVAVAGGPVVTARRRSPAPATRRIAVERANTGGDSWSRKGWRRSARTAWRAGRGRAGRPGAGAPPTLHGEQVQVHRFFTRLAPARAGRTAEARRRPARPASRRHRRRWGSAAHAGARAPRRRSGATAYPSRADAQKRAVAAG